MTTDDAGARTGWLAYWRLPPDDRRAVRRIERTCRATGEARLDDLALARLRRAAGRERLFAPLVRLVTRDSLTAHDRLARLCSTMRHPSRTGICTGATPRSVRPRTS